MRATDTTAGSVGLVVVYHPERISGRVSVSLTLLVILRILAGSLTLRESRLTRRTSGHLALLTGFPSRDTLRALLESGYLSMCAISAMAANMQQA